MLIKRIELTNFVGHKSRVLDLPQKGLVLITGPNGSGKSSFIEAVSFGLWGETLRGETPWHTNIPGKVRIVTDKLEVTRGITKEGKASLTWNLHGEKPYKGDTPTKTQAALTANVEPFDIWRYGSVLSAADAAHFTLARDAERKELLETMLGLGSTEPAVKALRADMKAQRDELRGVEARIAVVEVSITAAAKRIEDAERTRTAPITGAPATQEDVDRIVAAGKQVAVDLSDVQARHSEGARAVSGLALEIAGLRRDYVNLRAQSELTGSCVTCGRPVDEGFAEHCALNITPRLTELEAKIAALVQQRDNTQAYQDSLAEEVRKLTASRDELRAQHRVMVERVKATIARDQEAARIAAEAAEQRDTLLAELEGLKARKSGLTEQLRIGELAESVLDTRGLRTYMLGTAVDALTFTANQWMARIARPDFRIVIKPYADKGVRNAISIDVRGAGGGHGYKASSGGERKRIDIAILLALGELARAAHGVDVSTLFFDECFDALDVEGVEAVSEVLRELAETRCVVVIAHSPLVISALKRVAVSVNLTPSKPETTRQE